ncbi:hypothetical protein BGV71_14105 [Burkholderia ubonensis]|uniref:acyltransferase family protein n=1 Tax=Burkholderia ubonensis TaxID=101571 RepID=UPI0008FD9C6B|nr:acyltransferase [Burkholderia ubonensis]OJA82901.1 hypothetical protein BGV71_14105 [Burkholderia ubonensis]
MKATKIDSLTSLRFFAAAAIALFHASITFPILAPARQFALTQGVAIFFVLSGFVLSHAHKSIAEPGETGRFYASRIARIWPLHAITAMIAIWLAHIDGAVYAPVALIANALLLQAWFPNESVYFSANGVSWTLSDEAFFYALFPVLATIRRRPLVLFGTFSLAVLMLSAFRGFDRPWMLWSATVSPVTRLNEFMLGIVIYGIYDSRLRQIRISRLRATALELGATMLCVWTMYFGTLRNIGMLPVAFWKPINIWISNTGTGIPAALLILACAMQRGCISRAISARPLVFLGEISFAIYMTHELVLHAMEQRHEQLSTLEQGWQVTMFVVATLAISAFSHICIERPIQQRLRPLILRLFPHASGA